MRQKKCFTRNTSARWRICASERNASVTSATMKRRRDAATPRSDPSGGRTTWSSSRSGARRRMRHWTTEVHSLEARRKDEVLSLQEQRQVEMACVEEARTIQAAGYWAHQAALARRMEEIRTLRGMIKFGKQCASLHTRCQSWCSTRHDAQISRCHELPESRNPGHGIPTPNTFASKSIARDLQAATTRAPSSDERIAEGPRTDAPPVRGDAREACLFGLGVMFAIGHGLLHPTRGGAI